MKYSLSAALVAGTALASAFIANPAAALIPVSSTIVNGLNTITDNSAELFVNKVGGATTLDVGDIFLGGIQIDKINNTTIGSNSGFNELTGVFGIQILAIAPAGAGLSIITFGALGTLPSSGDLQAEILLASGGTINIGATTAGSTFARFFEDSTPDATRDGGSFLSFLQETTDGTQFLDAALAPGGLTSIGFPDISALAAFCATQQQGGGIPGNFFNNPGGVTISSSSTSAIAVGSPVGVSGTNQCPVLTAEDFTVRDDATFTVIAQIPEPATLALFGAGVLAVGAARRRKV